jgi:GntR family transcriptional repressor for pyruvate dehydrogenase complex
VPNARQELVGRIYKKIKDGSLATKDKLPSEREIASIFETSRTSAREALIVLETLGFIEVRGKEGMYIRKLNEEEFNRSLDLYSTWPTAMLPQTFHVRIMLESEAAALAASARTDEDIQRLNSCVHGFIRIYQNHPLDWNKQGSNLNELFHRLIIEASHNEVLLRIHEGLLRTIKRASAPFGAEAMITPLSQWEENIIKGHRILVDAIEQQDEKSARDLMRRHLAITSQKLDLFYKKCMESVFPSTESPDS